MSVQEPITQERMGKYPLLVPPVPSRMSREGDMLGNTTILKFLDHDIIDEQPFPELAREKYSCAESVSDVEA